MDRGPSWQTTMLALGLLVGCASCSHEPSSRTPTGALRLFVDAMDRSQWDPSALRDAYGLLSSSARDRLRERAKLATSLAGRKLEPWDVLAQGRFRLRFAPQWERRTKERVDRDRATVIVRGSGEKHRAEVPMVREEGAWHVALEIPPVTK